MQFKRRSHPPAPTNRWPEVVFPISHTASQATIAECYLGAFQTMWPDQLSGKCHSGQIVKTGARGPQSARL